MHIESGLYPTIVDIMVAMNGKVRNRIDAQKYECNGNYVSVYKITQKMPFDYLRINRCLQFKLMI